MTSILFIGLAILASFSGASEVVPSTLYDQDGLPLPEDPSNPAVNWTRVTNANGQNNHLRGIGRLYNGSEGHCSTTLFKIPNCSDPKKQKAQVITNGHCTMGRDNMSVNFGEFADGKPEDSHRSGVSSVLFESYPNSVDLSIVELKEDYATLERYGVKPFELATTPIQPNQTFMNVGFPKSGLPENDVVMRRSECRNPRKTNVIDLTQMWTNALEFTGCSVSGGSSGSSLITDGKIFGVVNSGAVNRPSDGKPACQADTCSYDGQNPPSHQLKNYGFDVTALAKCYKDCKLNTELPGCPLPNQASLITARRDGPHPGSWVSSLKQKVILNSRFQQYQIKGCSQGYGSCDCNSPDGYQPAATRPAGSGVSIEPHDYLSHISEPKAVAGAAPSFHFLCIRGQNADGSLDDIKNVRTYPLYLHSSNSRPPILGQ